MQPPHSESIAFLFRELVKQLPTGLNRSEIEDAANIYVEQENEFAERCARFAPRKVPIVRLRLHTAPEVVNNRISERERQDKGMFPTSALLPKSWMDVRVEKYGLESLNELLTSIEFREGLDFKRLDFFNARVINDLRDPEIDEVEYEIEEIDGVLLELVADKE